MVELVRGGQLFDSFAADYDRFSRLEPPRVANWLLTQLPAHAGRALDAGCGSGRHTQALAERFDEIIGIDISAPLRCELSWRAIYEPWLCRWPRLGKEKPRGCCAGS